MIESIVIENLRGLKKCSIEGLTNVNMFIGKNGVGKSTILEAIYLASSTTEAYDRLRDLGKIDYTVWRRCNRGSWDTHREILWFNKNIEEEIRIELRFKTQNTLRFKIPYWASSARSALLEVLPEIALKAGISHPQGSLYLGWDQTYSSRLWEPRWKTPLRALSSEEFIKIIYPYEREIMYLKNIVFLDSRIAINNIEKRVWKELLDKRLDKLVVGLIKEEYEPTVESVGYKPAGSDFVLAIWTPSTAIEVDGLGDGARMAILYASILALIKNTGVLIEDPEVHQHPGGLTTLMKFTLKVAKERNLQLFISSHSIELVNIVKRLCSELGLDVKVFFVDRDHDAGIANVRILESVDVEILQEIGLDPRLLHIL